MGGVIGSASASSGVAEITQMVGIPAKINAITLEPVSASGTGTLEVVAAGSDTYEPVYQDGAAITAMDLSETHTLQIVGGLSVEKVRVQSTNSADTFRLIVSD